MARFSKAEKRIAIERRIVRETAKALIAAGYKIAIHDGESICCLATDRMALINKAIMSTDEDTFIVKTKQAGTTGKTVGWIKFVYGNDGWDVINDYTTNLEGALKPVFEYIERNEQ